MKTTKFYPTIWQTIPYSFDVVEQWDAKGRRIKDLVLKNSFASKKGVSEMILNINKHSAFDKNGIEHVITDFPPQAELNLKGLHTGVFLKSKSVLELNPGEYTVFRFYLNKTGNSFSYSDRSTEAMFRFGHLDFEIENGLHITGDEAREVILRFDFVPYTLASYFKPFLNLFKKSKSFSAKLVNSFGN